MSSVASYRVLPDGSRCYSGSSCKRHGGNVADMIANQLKVLKKKTATVEASEFPVGSLRTGLNGTSPDWAEPLYDASRAVEKGLSKEMQNSLRSYAMGSYVSVNSLLREGNEGMEKEVRDDFKHSTVSDELLEEYRIRAEKITQDLDRAFAEHEVSFAEPIVLYRAVHVNPQGKTPLQHIKSSHKIGDIVEDSGFVSTSADSDYMSFFGRNRVKKHGAVVVYEILAKKGLPIFRETLKEEEGRSRIEQGNIQSYEREVLLNRGSKFKVVNVKNVTFEHSYNNKDLGYSYGDLPKKMTVPVIQVIQL